MTAILQTSEFSVRAGDAAGYMEIVAWFVAITAVIALAATWAWLKHSGVGAEERRQLAAIVPGLFAASAATVTLSRADGAAARRDDLRRLLSRAPDDAGDAGEQTVRGAVRDFGADLRSVMPDAPALAIRGALEGVGILAFGAVLFLSASRWEGIMEWSGATDTLLEATALAWAAVTLAVTLFPVPETLLVVVLTVVTLGYGLFLDYWFVVGLGLLAGAGAFALIDRYTADDLEVTLYPERRWAIGFAAGWLAAVWLVGAVGTVILEQLVGGAVATLGGFAGATIVLLAGAMFVLYDLVRRVIRAKDRPGENTRAVAAYVLCRRGLFFAVVVSTPLLAYLAYQATLSGRLGTVTAIVWAAPLLTRVGLLAGGLGLVVLVLSRTTGGIGFLDALGRLWRSTAIRGWLFARGIPATAMILAFLATWAFVGTRPIGDLSVVSALLGLWPPLVAAIVAGVVVRCWTLLWTRLRYRFLDLYGRDDYHRHVAVACYPELKDADGEPLYVARVLGEDLANRDVDRLVRDVETVAGALFAGERIPATMSSYYWEDVSRGTVDLQEVRRELRGDVLTRIEATFRANGGEVDDVVFDEQLVEDYPEQAIGEMLEVLHRSSDVSHRDGTYIYHGMRTSGGRLSRVLPWG